MAIRGLQLALPCTANRGREQQTMSSHTTSFLNLKNKIMPRTMESLISNKKDDTTKSSSLTSFPKTISNSNKIMVTSGACNLSLAFFQFLPCPVNVYSPLTAPSIDSQMREWRDKTGWYSRVPVATFYSSCNITSALQRILCNSMSRCAVQFRKDNNLFQASSPKFVEYVQFACRYSDVHRWTHSSILIASMLKSCMHPCMSMRLN